MQPTPKRSDEGVHIAKALRPIGLARPGQGRPNRPRCRGRQEFQCRYRESELVGPCGRRSTGKLLRCHVATGAATLRIAADNRHAKVHDPAPAVVPDQYVIGLEITVNDPGAVSRRESGPRIDQHSHNLRPAAGTFGRPPTQGASSWDKLHDQVHLTIGLARFVHRHHVRVAEARQCPCLHQDPLAGVVARSAKHLERDDAVETGVVGPKHPTHRPRPQQLEDLEAGHTVGGTHMPRQFAKYPATLGPRQQVPVRGTEVANLTEQWVAVIETLRHGAARDVVLLAWSMVSDESLLQAWRAGDSRAANELLDRYFPAMLRFFRSKLGDDVEDLIQRTFLDCVESHQRVDANFRAYLFGIARNRLIDHLRRRQRSPAPADLTSRSVADLGTSPSQLAVRSERQRRLQDALRHLPLDFQITVELAYWEGLSGPEIAAVTAVNEATVRSRLTRARSLLRERMVAAGFEAADLQPSG